MLLGEWYIIVQMMKKFEGACPEGIGFLGNRDFTTWGFLPRQIFWGLSGQIFL
jgi:hypothetical protein